MSDHGFPVGDQMFPQFLRISICFNSVKGFDNVYDNIFEITYISSWNDSYGLEPVLFLGWGRNRITRS